MIVILKYSEEDRHKTHGQFIREKFGGNEELIDMFMGLECADDYNGNFSVVVDDIRQQKILQLEYPEYLI